MNAPEMSPALSAMTEDAIEDRAIEDPLFGAAWLAIAVDLEAHGVTQSEAAALREGALIESLARSAATSDGTCGAFGLKSKFAMSRAELEERRATEKRYDELGYENFLKALSSDRDAGRITLEAFAVRAVWAKRTREQLNDSARERAVSELARKEQEAREANALDRYAEALAEPNAEDSRPDFSESAIEDFENLRSLIAHNRALTRNLPNALTQAMRFVAWRDGEEFDERQARYVPVPRRWLIGEDRDWIVPPGQSAAMREDFAQQWRASIPSLRNQEVAVFVPPGAALQFALWSPTPLDESEVHSYFEALSRSTVDPRYTAVVYPWRMPSVDWKPACVYLPPTFRTTPSMTFREKASGDDATGAGLLLNTGIESLDKQFRPGGLPPGARVVIGGLTGQGKTSLALHLAEAAFEQGHFVVWLAYDESQQEIEARRLQRRGVPPDVAQTLPIAELEKLHEQDFFVLPPGEPIETLAQQAHEEAAGRPVLFVIDSIQKVETRAGDGKGERERITAAIDAIQTSQAKYPSIMIMTAEIARGSGATKGSGSIDYGATLALQVRRRETQLFVEIKKNRHGSERPLQLVLDGKSQRLLDPDTAAVAGARLAVWEQICRALAEHGPLSRSGLETWVTANSPTLRLVLKERCEAGELLRENGKYRRK